MSPYVAAGGLLVLAAVIGWPLVAPTLRMPDPATVGAPRCGRFTRRGQYIPDIEAHRKHDEMVLFAAHPADFHVWVGTADGQVCSFCGRVRDWTEPQPEPEAEEYPLWLARPASGEAA